MTAMTNATYPAERIQRQLKRLAHLRGLGPVPDAYARWIDETRHMLLSTFGEGSHEAREFFQAVGEKASGYGLPLHGDWGIWARLKRGETVLRQVLARLEHH
jgi:hypothetical protein